MNTKDLVIGKVQTLMDTMKSVTLNVSYMDTVLL